MVAGSLLGLDQTGVLEVRSRHPFSPLTYRGKFCEESYDDVGVLGRSIRKTLSEVGFSYAGEPVLVGRNMDEMNSPRVPLDAKYCSSQP